MIRVTLLGTGAALPTARRGPPGILLKGEKSGAALVDPGPGALHRAAMAGTAVEEIRSVYLTHHHPDHTTDLISLLFARRSVLLKPHIKPLLLVGPKGTAAFCAAMGKLYGRWVEAPEEELSIVEIEPGTGEDLFAPLPAECGLPGKAAAVAHSDIAIGYRFETEEGTIAISGDSGVCPGLAALGCGADIFLLESSMPDEHAGTSGHLCPAEAGAIAAEARPGLLVLYHLYPPVNADAALKSVKTKFDGRALVAEDGLTLTL